MSKINDGGPAFPVNDTYHGVGNIERGSEGMTLRDFFAASATEEDIAAIMKQHIRSGFGAAHAGYSITRGQARYLHADDMLAAREQGESHD